MGLAKAFALAALALALLVVSERLSAWTLGLWGIVGLTWPHVLHLLVLRC